MLFRTSSPKAMVISYHDELENTHVLHFDQARWTHLTCDHSYIRTKIILILRIPRNKLEYAWAVRNIFHKIIVQYMINLWFSKCKFSKSVLNNHIVMLSSYDFSLVLLKIFLSTLDIVIDRKSNTSLTLSRHLIYLAPFCFQYKYRQNHWQ